MHQLAAISLGTFRELRRERIFVPMAVGAVILLALAHLVSSWAIEEPHKILYDLMAVSCEALGGVIAILWGSELIGSGRSRREWEVVLVAPLPRGVWVLGRFAGLCCCLLLFALLLTGVATIFLAFNAFPAFTAAGLWFFASHSLAWLVLAAMSMWYGTFCGRATALFAGFSTWAAGLVSRPLAEALPQDTPAWGQGLVHSLAWFWDLQRFTGAAPAPGGEWAAAAIAAAPLATFLYGAALSSVFLGLAALSLNRRDL